MPCDWGVKADMVLFVIHICARWRRLRGRAIQIDVYFTLLTTSTQVTRRSHSSNTGRDTPVEIIQAFLSTHQQVLSQQQQFMLQMQMQQCAYSEAAREQQDRKAERAEDRKLSERQQAQQNDTLLQMQDKHQVQQREILQQMHGSH